MELAGCGQLPSKKGSLAVLSVIINHFAVRPSQHWNIEAGLPDAAAHAIHGSIVFSGIASVENQFVDGPDLDFTDGAD